ncbi:MAG: BspA family leucine-rich repeat surface protein, partial [Bacteroidota bacterium]
SMSDIFNGAGNFNDDISDWDVSNVTNMKRAFRDARSYNLPLDNWDVSNVTQFDQIFTRMPAFDQPLGNWKFKQGANVREFSSGQTNKVSCANWSTTIRGWLHNNPDVINLRISGFPAAYDSLAAVARDTLIARGWTIIGSNIGGDCGSVDPCDNDLRAPEVEELDDIRAQCEVNMIPAPVAVDLCQGEITGVTDDPLSYNEKGVYRITWVFDDGVGNVDSAVQLVIIDDTTAPDPDVESLPQVTAQCGFTVTIIPTATDNCEGPKTATTDDPLTYNEQGTFTITWTYADNEGNISSQEQTVIIADTEAPVPDITELPNITGECITTVTAPAATDNCSGPITATTDDPVTYNEQGIFTITWTYDDGNGNTVTQDQTVIVDDDTAPMITLIGEGSITLDCKATGFDDPGATASDNCDGVIVETTGTVDFSTPGTYTLRYKAVDVGNNESAEVTRTVVVPTIEECTDCVQDLILTAALLAADPHASLFSADNTITIDGIITSDEQISLHAPNGIEFLGGQNGQFEVQSQGQLEVTLDACSDLLVAFGSRSGR